MFRRRFVGLLLGGLLLFGLFGMAGRSSYSRGWSEGYFAGQQVEVGEDGETAVSPQPTYRAPYGRHYSPFGWFIGGIFKFWITLMLIGMFFKMFFFRRFRGRGRHRHSGQHWHSGQHRHGPPWCWHSEHDEDDGEPHEKSPEDVEPDIA